MNTFAFCHHCKKTSYNPDDDDIQFCVYCGWSLGKVIATITPDPIVLIGYTPTPCTVMLTHEGAGSIRFAFSNLPAGVQSTQAVNNPAPLSAKNPRFVWKFDLLPNAVPEEAKDICFTLDTNTREPLTDDPDEIFRPANMDVHSEMQVRATLERKRLGPTFVLSKTLIFRSPHQSQSLCLHNEGDAEDDITLEVTEGDFRIEQEGVGVQTKGTLTIDARERRHISITPPPYEYGRERYNGKLKVSGLGFTTPQEVVLFAQYPKPLEKPRERWIIGIDFGTYKSAVFVIDNLNAPETLIPIEWNNSRQSLPSVVMYPPAIGDPPLFGWEVPASVTSDSLVIRSVKKLLSSDTEYPHEATARTYTAPEVVTDFLTFLYQELQSKPLFNGKDPFSNARVVMSLPVLGNEIQFNEQRERTLDAAELAGFPRHKIETLSEPEAAAIDFLYHHEQWGMTDLHDGDYICVFDSGAGTTDICILEITQSQGVYQFKRHLRLGFPIGGDLVDALLAERIMENSPKKPDEYSHTAFVDDIRRAKEKLSFPPDETRLRQDSRVELNAPDTFGEGAVVSWSLIASLYNEYLHKMLEIGITESDTYPILLPEEGEHGVNTVLKRVHFKEAYPSLRDKMREIPRVKWLCLTGGSTFIPCVVERVRRLFTGIRYLPKPPQVASQQGTATPFYTLNVARGATLSPLVDSTDNFPFTIGVRFTSASHNLDEPSLIRAGCSVNTESDEHTVILSRKQTGTITVYTRLKIEGEEREYHLYEDTIVDRQGLTVDLRMGIHLHYRPDAHLHLIINYPQYQGREDDIVIM